MAEPFQRLSRRVLFESSWHRYCHDRYVRADGSAGDYYYVDVPGSCGIVPLWDDGTTVLLRTRRYLLGGWIWEFPIGGMEPGDDPRSAAARELEEETGLRARTWHELGSFAPYKGVSNELCRFFVARDLEQGAPRPEASEAITVHRMPLAEARERLFASRPLDGQSLTALALLDRHLGDARC
jgi:ADP-ribose pyrophosphatase